MLLDEPHQPFSWSHRTGQRWTRLAYLHVSKMDGTEFSLMVQGGDNSKTQGGNSVVDDVPNTLDDSLGNTDKPELDVCGGFRDGFTVLQRQMKSTNAVTLDGDRPGVRATQIECDSSADLIEQFTPVENDLDPIEQFSLDAGVESSNCLQNAMGDGSLGQADNSFTMDSDVFVRFDEKVFDDGFTSIAGDASVSGTAASESVACDLDHVATQSALEQSLAPQKPQFMWEQDGFLNAVFGNGDVVSSLFPQHNMKRPHTALIDLTGANDYEPEVIKALRRGQPRPVYARVFKQSAIVSEETQRANFVNGWTSIVLLNVHAFAAFDKARLECGDSELRIVVHQTVMECLARKATSTIGKRLGAMKKFAEFCFGKTLCPFPLEDVNLHAYLSSLLEDSRTSGSSGKGFLEAVRFSSAMLGLRSDEVQTISRRVAGLAELLIKRAPVIVQASPLTVEHVKTLERSCCSAEPLQDKVILGGILIMIYGSARASDMARAIKILIDLDDRQGNLRSDADPVGYLELGVLGNKGARKDAHRRLLLPVVAPIFCLSGCRWWESWEEARAALGLSNNGLLDLPLLCRFDLEGKALDQSMVASEIGEFMRQSLGVQTQARNVIRSHSCKATLLSWLSKYGVPLPIRRLVGHHLDPGAKSAETYARDAMSPAIRAVMEVLNAVKSGAFQPDATRSGRFNVQPDGGGGPCDGDESEGSYQMPFTESERLGGDSDTTATDTSSDASSDKGREIDDATTLWQLLKPEHRPILLQVSPELGKFVHKISRVIHLRKDRSEKFLCGHVLNHRYVEHVQAPSAECPRCTTCFSSKDAQLTGEPQPGC